MEQVLVYVVTQGNRILMETLDRSISEQHARDSASQTGVSPLIHAYPYTPTDHTLGLGVGSGESGVSEGSSGAGA